MPDNSEYPDEETIIQDIVAELRTNGDLENALLMLKRHRTSMLSPEAYGRLLQRLLTELQAIVQEVSVLLETNS